MSRFSGAVNPHDRDSAARRRLSLFFCDLGHAGHDFVDFSAATNFGADCFCGRCPDVSGEKLAGESRLHRDAFSWRLRAESVPFVILTSCCCLDMVIQKQHRRIPGPRHSAELFRPLGAR